MVKVYKQPTWLLLLLFVSLFACGMMVEQVILKIVVLLFPVGGIVSTVRHRNDKVLISDKGLESDFKPILKNTSKRTLIPWKEISYIEIFTLKTGAVLYVHNRKDIYEKDVSFLFPLGNVKKLKRSILEIGHVSCKIMR